jgi:hypothetical protein
MNELHHRNGRIGTYSVWESVCNVTIFPNLIKYFLLVLYRYDFELFGYSLDGYLELGMTETNRPDTPTTWHILCHIPSYFIWHWNLTILSHWFRSWWHVKTVSDSSFCKPFRSYSLFMVWKGLKNSIMWGRTNAVENIQIMQHFLQQNC